MSSTPIAEASVEDALQSCAAEPIRIPGAIQPHGVLLVLDPDSLQVLQASVNASDVLSLGASPLGSMLDDLDRLAGLGTLVRTWLGSGLLRLATGWTGSGGAWQVGAHHGPQGVLLELERDDRTERTDLLSSLNSTLRLFVEEVEPLEDVVAIQHAAARQLRHLTGFNRVLVYRFDADWHGTVVAESSDGVLPSYLDLRFPASDIPAQARELYVANRLRLIASSDYLPVPIEPAASPIDDQPLDLSQAALRSVSPIHLQYMRNMGTGASMSLSIVVDGRLWGLISCHHKTPRHVDASMRSACDFLSHIVSMQTGARERGAYAAARISRKRIETALVAHLSRAPTIQDGLVEHEDLWLGITHATGAALVFAGAVDCVGDTPSVPEVEALAQWLTQHQRGEAVFRSDRLPELFEPAAAYADVASGIIAASISRLHTGYVIWFRSEVVRTVTWGGDPSKAVDDSSGRLAPRHSFDAWKETVRGRSAPWQRAEIDAAIDLRSSIIDFVLLRAEERASLTEQLERSNQELESFSYSVSHDLRAPFRHIVGFARLLKDREQALDAKSRHYVDSIVESALAAGHLVDDLLHFSQLGRSSLDSSRVDMDKLVRESVQSLSHETEGRTIDWQIEPLPPTRGDGSLLRQAVTNLVANAIKYSAARDPAVIRISGEEREHETVYVVSDNGIGFDMAYVDKLFGVFQRLHRVEDYQGNGIGLALARRIVDRHGGWIEAEGEVDVGATFRIGLPRMQAPTSFSHDTPFASAP